MVIACVQIGWFLGRQGCDVRGRVAIQQQVKTAAVHLCGGGVKMSTGSWLTL